MVAQLVPAPHPILSALTASRDAMSAVREVQPVYMSAAEKKAAVTELARLEAVAAELKLRVVATADDAANLALSRDTGSWLASVTRADFASGRADARLAEALDRSWTAVAAGMADGKVSLAQARVVVESLEALPADLDAALVEQAQTQMVTYCEQFRPSELRRLGRHLLEVVAPEIAEAEEAKRLEDEEQRARENASLRIKRLGDGRTRTTIVHPDADADRLATYLDAYTSPRHDDGVLGAREADRIPLQRKRGHAFGALLERLDPAKLPVHGGDATTVMVTIPLEHLQRQLATAGLLDGDLSASQARRLACSAKIIPVVLGGKGEILDLGRSQRLFSAAQRKALRLRDRRCRAEGCTVPATWCEAHHLDPWSRGGKTDLADGVLLCSWHHHRIHDRRCATDKLPDGDLRFHRRT